MDGLPGLKRAINTGVTDNVKPIKKMVGQYAPTSGPRLPRRVYTAKHLVAVGLLSAILSAFLVLVALVVGGTDRLQSSKIGSSLES